MAWLSHIHKCVFNHIPKCGGTTVGYYLAHYASAFRCDESGGFPIRRLRTGGIVNTHPEYFHFTFVRNPYDRFVSYYLHGMRLQQRRGVRFYRNIHECLEFSAELLGCADFEKVESPRFGTVPLQKGFGRWAWWHCRRQKDFLLEYNPAMFLSAKRVAGNRLSFIGRLENFDEDFMLVRKILRLPRVSMSRMRVSEDRGHYSEYYDAAARRRVEALYAEDLEILGYEYERKGVVRSPPPLYDLKRAEQCRLEFSRRERRILFWRTLYFRTRWTLRSTPLTPLWRLLPRRWRRRLAVQTLLKTGR